MKGRRLRTSFRRRAPRLAGTAINLGRMARVVASPETRNLADLAELHETHLRTRRVEIDGGRSLVRRYLELGADQSHVRRLFAQEARVFSQNGEDGVILHLLESIGVGSRSVLEIGSGGWSSNIANLVVHFGFVGHFVDADPAALAQQQRQVADAEPRKPISAAYHLHLVRPDDVESSVVEWTGNAELDVLSLDIDSNDYWVLENLGSVRPRLLVVEYNASFGPDAVVSIPYDPSFDRWKAHESGWYYGASLGAFAKLCAARGYSLMGCDSTGVNAFFARADLIPDSLEPATVAEAFYPDARRGGARTLDEQMALTHSLGVTEV